MRMMINEQEKSQLANEIFDISKRPVACVHIRHRYFNRRPFIDWYLVLKVNENAELEAIRKQYHKLALQLHPDKNKHSKAETAFKLVSEAYFCLSDNSKRAAFDSDRKNTCCIECKSVSYMKKSSPNHSANVKIRIPDQEAPQFDTVQRRINELRNKLKKEAEIIEKCLAANSAASRTDFANARATRAELPVFNPADFANARAARAELPVFNPADYQYKGYPHHRTVSHNKLDNLRGGFMIGNKGINNSPKHDSPVFEYRSGRASSLICRTSSMRGK